MPLIEVKALTKEFTRGSERIVALNEIGLTIGSGEFVAITGPSGSGKSTLMYILGLLDRQTSGSYLLDGNSTDLLNDDQRAQLRNQKLGFIFQTFHLLSRATALRNVAMPLVYAANYERGLTEREMEDRARVALEKVGLADRLLHVPNQLSGGQRQRVAIARALVNNPRILFADEPTGNLDSVRGQEILDLFEILHNQGVTVIIVTHDPAIAERAHRELVLRDGKIVEDRRHAG